MVMSRVVHKWRGRPKRMVHPTDTLLVLTACDEWHIAEFTHRWWRFVTCKNCDKHRPKGK